jgi:hypothetical protein
MSKCLPVVAFALLVLSGAMGLRNIAAANAVTSSTPGISAQAMWANGGGPSPKVPGSGGGGQMWANGGGPSPKVPGGGGGGQMWANGGGPSPKVPGGGGGGQ